MELIFVMNRCREVENQNREKAGDTEKVNL